MPGLSTPLANSLANLVLRATAYTAPTATWLSLHVGDPTRDPTTAATTEVGGGVGYGRVHILTADWGAPVDGLLSPTVDVVFSTATGDWGNCTHVGVWDAFTAGNYLLHGALQTPHHIVSGETPQYSAGNLSVRFF